MANKSKNPPHRKGANEAVSHRSKRPIRRKQGNDFLKTLGRLLGDRRRLERLLALEKQRRALPADALVFVGMRNVAKHWWCTQQAVLSSLAEEINFFAAYLEDRIENAYQLGLIDKLPRLDAGLLDVGREITLSMVEGFRESEQKASINLGAEVIPDAVVAYMESVDKDGNRTRFINPDLPQADKSLLEKEAATHGIRVIDDPILRGNFLEGTRAEKYPQLRWNFNWGDYTIVGVADGLMKEFVYEFKTTKKRYYLQSARPVAQAQADLYGYFFHRAKKRVQFYIVEEAKTETYDESVNVARAEETLRAFARVDQGEPAHPPQPWKCRICDFRASCAISQAR